MNSEVTPDTAPAGPPGDAAAQQHDKQKQQRVMYSECCAYLSPPQIVPALLLHQWLWLLQCKQQHDMKQQCSQPTAVTNQGGVSLSMQVHAPTWVPFAGSS
jgi:hypothetical protein